MHGLGTISAIEDRLHIQHLERQLEMLKKAGVETDQSGIKTVGGKVKVSTTCPNCQLRIELFIKLIAQNQQRS